MNNVLGINSLPFGKSFQGFLDCFLDLLFVNLGEKEATLCQSYIDQLRASGVKCELFPDPLKLKKQILY